VYVDNIVSLITKINDIRWKAKQRPFKKLRALRCLDAAVLWSHKKIKIARKLVYFSNPYFIPLKELWSRNLCSSLLKAQYVIPKCLQWTRNDPVSSSWIARLTSWRRCFCSFSPTPKKIRKKHFCATSLLQTRDGTRR